MCVFCFCRPNSFVIITANRVIHCNTDTPEEMHHWIGLLQKSKGDTRVDGQEFLVRGQWLQSSSSLPESKTHAAGYVRLAPSMLDAMLSESLFFK